MMKLSSFRKLLFVAMALLVLPIAQSHTAMVPLVVAGWFGLFSIPSLILLKDRKKIPGSPAGSDGLMRMGLGRVVGTFKEIRKHRNLMRFLLSYFFYNNAVITIIVFAVALCRDSLSFTTTENIIVVMVMNIIAAPGANSYRPQNKFCTERAPH